MDIYSKFLQLESEKQNKIINAATSEFAYKGYKNASTNEIVKVAEISKGLIFHYFKTKKQLYLFLYDYLMEVMVEEYFKKPWLEERDFFARMKKAAIIKLELFRKHPLIFKFFLTAYTDTDPEVRVELEERKQSVMDSNLPNIYQNVDLSSFKEDIDPEKALKLIVWALEGYANSKIHDFKTMDEQKFSDMVTELGTYLDILRKSFYKN